VRASAARRSPITALLFGLVLTLATVVAYSWYVSRQISGLQRLQTDLVDRNRRESLQLLRIQNDLNQLALAMRDMLDGDSPYPLTAWSSQFERIRVDLDDALSRQSEVSSTRRTPEQATYLASSLAQFWDAVDRTFALAASGREAEARSQIQLSLQARQAALSTAVARLLVQNNEAEAQTAQQAQAIYAGVQRQVYVFLSVALVAIAATSLYMMRVNRRLFAELATLSDDRRDLARQLIAARESTLREISRELHDEFGQLLTAMGSMLARATRQVPQELPLRADLREIGEVAQAALDNVRGLSQALHPSMLEELGLDSGVEWYLSTVERQLGLRVRYTRSGTSVPLEPTLAIHVYRVLQEALTNVARHSGVLSADVELAYAGDRLTLTVTDGGRGLAPGSDRGVGLVGMRERASLLGGRLDIGPSRDGGTGSGTVVRLDVPLARTTPAGKEATARS